MSKELYTMYSKLYKKPISLLLNASDQYIEEFIIFIVLSKSKSYYPPFEIKYYIDKLQMLKYDLPLLNS